MRLDGLLSSLYPWHLLSFLYPGFADDFPHAGDFGLDGRREFFACATHGFRADACESVGLYFGTSGGELWMSRDEGRKWSVLARNLPEIYSVETAQL